CYPHGGVLDSPTVEMSQSELAKLAFDALLKEVKRETAAPEGTAYVLKTRLVPRSSTTFPQSDHQATAQTIIARRFPTPTINANRVLPAHRCGPPGNRDPLLDLLVARVRYTA